MSGYSLVFCPKHSSGSFKELTPFYAGVSYLVYVTLNGVQLTKEQVSSCTWTVAGNNILAVQSLDYTVASGEIDTLEPVSYPLEVTLLPRVYGVPLLMGSIAATGNCTLQPEPFDIQQSCTLICPGAGEFAQNQFGALTLAENPVNSGIWNVYLGDANGNPVGCQLTFTLNAVGRTGTIYVIQLVDYTKIATQTDGNIIILEQTNGTFYFDGSTYPYGSATQVTGPGVFTNSFVDIPRSYLPAAYQAYKSVSCVAQFNTYFLFQDAAAAASPVMLMNPVGWGWTWEASYSLLTGEWEWDTAPILAAPELNPVGEPPTWPFFSPEGEPSNKQ